MKALDVKDMLIQCIDVDCHNIGYNGFDSIDEVFDWWMGRTDLEIIKIYNDYYGLEGLGIKSKK